WPPYPQHPSGPRFGQRCNLPARPPGPEGRAPPSSGEQRPVRSASTVGCPRSTARSTRGHVCAPSRSALRLRRSLRGRSALRGAPRGPFSPAPPAALRARPDRHTLGLGYLRLDLISAGFIAQDEIALHVQQRALPRLGETRGGGGLVRLS